MAENTKIEWAHHTFNPWIGCTKVGPGCDNCYAEADFDKRRHVVHWGPNQPRKRTAPSTWAQPLRWNKMAEAEGTRYRVFCASLADVFDNEVPDEWRLDLFRLIRDTPHLDWLLLTKRIGNARIMLSNVRLQAEEYIDPFPWPNAWIGATITSQVEADRDIPKLLDVPAAKRFLSMEPLLGPVDLQTACTLRCPNKDCWTHSSGHRVTIDSSEGGILVECICSRLNGLHWVIVGGESGPNARPKHPAWARSLRDQCQAAGVPFLFKQWGEWVDGDNGPDDDSAYEGKSDCWAHIEGGHYSGEMGVDFFNTYPMYRVGKKAAGRLLDGREWNEVPA